MSGRILQAILISTLISLLISQSCLNQNGSTVSWWMMLKYPGNTGYTGFAYYDSTMSSSNLLQFNGTRVDAHGTALANTVAQITSMNLQVLAWNDEMPNGTTSSSEAHSKSFFMIRPNLTNGIFIDHSIPKFPDFPAGVINYTVPDSENIYGQDIFCMSQLLSDLNQMAKLLLITRPYIYYSTITNSSSTEYLYQLSQSKKVNSTVIFNQYTFNSTVQWHMIFKNNYINSSIFEDGLNNYLSSPLIAETWGRPLEPAWCSPPYPVINVQTLRMSNGISWTETNDHSKWVVSVNSTYSCFGDMNRMPSQWTRGGSFYCVTNPNLFQAMNNIILATDNCSS